MDNRHADYSAYYEARMKRFAGNPAYARSYQAEQVLYQAISGDGGMEGFRTIMERDHPEVQCAIALVKDQESARLEHFQKLEETIRAKGPQRILAEIDKATTALDVANAVSKIEQEIGILISVDLFTGGFYGDFEMLENLAVMDAIKDEVPAEWRQEIKDNISETLAKQKAFYANTTRANNRNYKADWDYDYELVWQTRHRRQIPFADAIVTRRIAEHKRYNGTI